MKFCGFNIVKVLEKCVYIFVYFVFLNNCMYFILLWINLVECLSFMLFSFKLVGLELLKFVIFYRSVFILIVNVLMMVLLFESDLSFSWLGSFGFFLLLVVVFFVLFVVLLIFLFVVFLVLFILGGFVVLLVFVIFVLIVFFKSFVVFKSSGIFERSVLNFVIVVYMMCIKRCWVCFVWVFLLCMWNMDFIRWCISFVYVMCVDIGKVVFCMFRLKMCIVRRICGSVSFVFIWCISLVRNE